MGASTTGLHSPSQVWRGTWPGAGDVLLAVIDTQPASMPFRREVWSSAPLRPVMSFDAQTFDLGPVVFSPRQRYLFTDQRDGSVTMWRLPGVQ